LQATEGNQFAQYTVSSRQGAVGDNRQFLDGETMPQLLNQIRGERKLDKLTGLVRKMGPGTRGIFLLDVFSFRRLLAAAGICAFMACPAEPKLNLQPGYKVTFASRQGDTTPRLFPITSLSAPFRTLTSWPAMRAI